MTSPDPAQLQRFAEALDHLDRTLDWAALGGCYCDEGGEHFFSKEQRGAIQDAGLHFAGDLGERLPADGRSLYVGAGVAELVPMCFEALVLGRRIRAVTLPGYEADELNRGLASAAEMLSVPLPRLDTQPLDPERTSTIDHLWVVSVITDPEAFPALHDLLYERRGTQLATGKGSLKKERPLARDLLERAVATLRPPCWLSTTDEELPMVESILRERGLDLAVPRTARLSAIVGDAVRICTVNGGSRRAAPRRGRGRS